MNAATGTETAIEVTDTQTMFLTTEVPTARAAAETMAPRPAEGTTERQVEETTVLPAAEEITVRAVETTDPVVHMARTRIPRRATESLGTTAGEVDPTDSMDQEGEEILGVEGLVDETENEAFHQRDHAVLHPT